MDEGVLADWDKGYRGGWIVRNGRWDRPLCVSQPWKPLALGISYLMSHRSSPQLIQTSLPLSCASVSISFPDGLRGRGSKEPRLWVFDRYRLELRE